MNSPPIDSLALKRGQARVRQEDHALVTGSGCYTDDLRFDNCLHAVVVRAPHASAKILSIDTDKAADHAELIGIVVGAELVKAGIRGLPFSSTVKAPNGGDPKCQMLPILASTEVRYVGQPVAFVVARSRHAAYEIAELVEVSYEVTDCVVGIEQAVLENSPSVDPAVHDNVAAIYELGNLQQCKTVLAKCFRQFSIVVRNNRLIANPLEPRASIGQWHSEYERWTLHTGNQGPHHSRRMLSEALGCDESKLRLCIHRIGGGFGGKLTPYPEDVLVLYAAKKFGQTVRWRADRSEAFVADYHARDHVANVTVGFDDSAHIEVLIIDDLANLGAYPSAFGIPIATTTGNRVVSGVYHIPNLALSVKAVLTNTSPTAPYRGAGRPEVIHRLEVVLDLAANAFGIDIAEIRRRNLIANQQIPYKTYSGLTYDSGNFPHILERALEIAQWDSFQLRHQDSVSRGLLRGRGLACHIDSTSGVQPSEKVVGCVNAQGQCHFYSGTQEMGQGLSHTYAGIAATILEVPISGIVIHQGDTDLIHTGIGSYGSRSLMIGGAAIVNTANALLSKLLEIGANMLETETHKVFYERGKVQTLDRSQSVSIGELAGAQVENEIRVEGSAEAPFSFPNGCYVCEVEIEPETGVVRIDKFVGVDDVGHVLNETIVHGQTHGGLAQGIGQALFEQITYDDDGQLQSGSMLDYALPRASDLPMFEAHFDETQPATTNLLGVKGAGESGAVGGPPAVVSAIANAIPGCDFSHLQMPLTAEKIWRLINNPR